jgi:hypothetical protein
MMASERAKHSHLSQRLRLPILEDNLEIYEVELDCINKNILNRFTA